MNSLRSAWITALVALPVFLHTASADIAVRDGEKVAFLGDSITRLGWKTPGGYVRLVMAGLEANGIRIVPVPAGIAGNRSSEMLARIDHDVLAKKPDWMLLSCGVNDVCFGLSGTNGIALEPFKANIRAMVEKSQSSGMRLMILTASPIGEIARSPGNRALVPYNDFLRALAKEKNFPLADVNTGMTAVLKHFRNPETALTVDGLHPNAEGHKIFATCILRAFGLDDAQLEKARAAWTIPPKQ